MLPLNPTTVTTRKTKRPIIRARPRVQTQSPMYRMHSGSASGFSGGGPDTHSMKPINVHQHGHPTEGRRSNLIQDIEKHLMVHWEGSQADLKTIKKEMKRPDINSSAGLH